MELLYRGVECVVAAVALLLVAAIVLSPVVTVVYFCIRPQDLDDGPLLPHP